MENSLAFIGHPLTLSKYPYLLPSSRIFTAFQNCNLSELEKCSSEELLPILPSLVRIALRPPKDSNDIRYRLSQYCTRLVYNHPYATFITSLYEIDYNAIGEDTRKDISSREKLSRLEGKSNSISSSTLHQKSLLIGNIKTSLCLDFERSTNDHKVRLLNFEIIRLLYNNDSHHPDKFQMSELLCSQSFLPFFSQILCHIVHELPSLFTFSNLAEALSKIECGPEMLCNIAVNNPVEYQNILFTLVNNSEPNNIREDTNSIAILNPIRVRAICLLCEIQPSCYSIVRLHCLQTKRYLTLGFILALDETKLHTQMADPSSKDNYDLSDIQICDFSQLENHFDDLENNSVLSFLSALLFSSDEDTLCWLTNYFKQAMRRSTVSAVFNKIKHYLLEQVRTKIPQLRHLRKSSPPPNSLNSESEAMEVESTSLTTPTHSITVFILNSELLNYASLIIRIFCVLRLLSTLSIHTDEADTIFSLAIGTALVPTSHGVAFIKNALGMLILCPFFYSTTGKETIMLEWYDRVMQFVNTILEDSITDTTSKVLDFGLKELIISIHTQFYLLNYKNVISLLSDLMSIPLKNKNYILSKSKDIFLKVFNDDVCANLILSLAPTSKLISHSHQTEIEAVTLQSVLDFMKKKSIFHYQLDTANQWLLQQILASSLPINSTILAILQDYLKGLTSPSNTQNYYTPFPNDKVIAVFGTVSLLDDNQLASQLMLLYYLLYLTDSQVEEYVNLSANILETVQIKIVLDKASLHSSKCQELYPLLLKLVLNHYPQLWIPQNLIRTNLFDVLDNAKLIATKCQPLHIEKIINQKNPNFHILFIILKQLVGVHIETLRNFLPSLVSLIPLLLNESISRQTQNIYALLWKRLESVEPRRLWLSTANALVERPNKLTNNDLSIDPLILLQSDDRVFRTPPIFSILLHTLTAYLTASRSFLYKMQLQREKEQMADSNTIKELRTSIILTQESATIQLLIETCIPSEEDLDNQSCFGLHFSNLTEIQCLACCFIHQMIIADPQLVRIIHSQGYPSEIIPVLVQGVPSMHICTDSICSFLEESEDASGIVFVVQLAAEVFAQYPLPKTSGVCQKILIFLNNKLAQLKNSSERDDLFRPMLAALVQLAKTFPSLSEDITLLLLSLMKCEQARSSQSVENRDADIKSLCDKEKSFAQCILDAFDCLLEEVILKI